MYTLFTCIGALNSDELNKLMKQAVVKGGYLNIVEHLVTECKMDVNSKLKLCLLDIIAAYLIVVEPWKNTGSKFTVLM